MLRHVESDMMRVLRMSFSEACICQQSVSVTGRSGTVGKGVVVRGTTGAWSAGCWMVLRLGCSRSLFLGRSGVPAPDSTQLPLRACRLLAGGLEAGGVGSCRRTVGRPQDRSRAGRSEVSHSLSGGADGRDGVYRIVGLQGENLKLI